MGFIFGKMMSKLSQAQRIHEFLKANPLQKFKAKDIATGIIEMFPEDYVAKRENPRFLNQDDFINQVFAEIGAQKDNILNVSPYIHIQDKPRPRVFWYDQILCIKIMCNYKLKISNPQSEPLSRNTQTLLGV